jgi:hypothetical protein
MRAVLSVHSENWSASSEYIDQTRRQLSENLTALLTESYSRAYVPLIVVQQCSELEEILEYKQLLRAAAATAANSGGGSGMASDGSAAAGDNPSSSSSSLLSQSQSSMSVAKLGDTIAQGLASPNRRPSRATLSASRSSTRHSQNPLQSSSEDVGGANALSVLSSHGNLATTAGTVDDDERERAPPPGRLCIDI